MVHHPAFRVGKKPFAIAGMQSEGAEATVSVNLGPDAQPALLDDSRFARTPYIGQHGWVTVPHAALGKGELEALVLDSWRRIAGARQRAALEQAEAGAPSEASRARERMPTRAPAKRAPAKRTPAKRQPTPRKATKRGASR